MPAFSLHAMINLSGEVLPLIATADGEVDSSAWAMTNGILVFLVVVIVVIWGPGTLTRSAPAGAA